MVNNISNPYYPINDRMATLEDVFIEYMTIALNGNSYRLYEPDLFKCPTVDDVQNGVVVRFIDSDLYNSMLNQDTVTFTVKYWAETQKTNESMEGIKVTTVTGGVSGEDGTSDSTGTQINSEGSTWSYSSYSGYKSYQRVNKWYAYIDVAKFKICVDDAIVLAYQNLTHQLTISTTDLLEMERTIWSYMNKQNIAYAPDFNTLDPFDSEWTTVVQMMAQLVQDAFSLVKMAVGNGYVYMFTPMSGSTTIEPLEFMNNYYYEAYGVKATGNVTNLVPTVTAGVDAKGRYILCKYPDGVSKKQYIVRNIYTYSNNNVKSVVYYMDINGFHNIFEYLRAYVEKTYIYMGVYVSQLSINTVDGSQDNMADNQLFRMCDAAASAYFKIDSLYNSTYYTVSDEDVINLPYNIYSGCTSVEYTVNDITTQYFYNVNLAAYTKAIAIKDIYGESVTPGLFIWVEDKYMSQGTKYSYICNVTPTTGPDAATANHYLEGKDQQTYGFMPSAENTYSYPFLYTVNFTHLINGTQYIYRMYQWPATFLLYVEAISLSASAKYTYQIVDIEVTNMPNCQKVYYDASDKLCRHVMVYAAGMSNTDSATTFEVCATYRMLNMDGTTATPASLNPTGAAICNFNVCLNVIDNQNITYESCQQTIQNEEYNTAFQKMTYNSYSCNYLYGPNCLATANSSFSNIGIYSNTNHVTAGNWEKNTYTTSNTYWPELMTVSLELQPESANNDNVIIYTASSELSLISEVGDTKGILKTAFGDRTIVSATYTDYGSGDKGQGILTFDQSVTIIGDNAFIGCSQLTDILLPLTVTKIGDYAFQDCTSLATINFPDALTKIGDYAFSGCVALETISYTSTIERNIGTGAFDKVPDSTNTPSTAGA